MLRLSLLLLLLVAAACCAPNSNKKCVPVDQITQVGAKIRDTGVPTLTTNGAVFCSDKTARLAYINDNGDMRNTNEMVYKGGHWSVDFVEDFQGIKEVCCVGSK